ncbi:hypothetical protein [Leeia oryzae]|uniref:hypothetical protein n=1 Tax=Leeia oryzae TaxID=356662 RepID=UPI0003717518|nr:hypothetical protein [Leeia oryzae]
MFNPLKYLYLSFPLLITGCASLMNEGMQPVKVDAKLPNGQFIIGADCFLTNNFGSYAIKSGDTGEVHRSGNDLDIICTQQENQSATATGKAISRANASWAGNILLGGGIGAIIDHNTGTAYTYPSWVQVEFGKSLVFDRSNEHEGLPVIGTSPKQP